MSSPLRRKRRRVDKTGRSVGVERHVRLHYWMMSSPAWQTLSLPGRCLLIELYALYNGENNGELFLSVREAARRLRISKNTAGDLFTELKVRGFVRPRQEGSFHYKERHATAWVLTEFGFSGQLATKDFMHWQPAGISEAGPCQRDSVSQLQGQIAVASPVESTICPSLGDRNDDQVGGICPSHRDTDKLPSPVGESGAATTTRTTIQAITSAPPASFDQTASQPAERHRHHSEPDSAPVVERDPRQVDLVDWLNGTAAMEKPAPVEKLRAELTAYLERSPKGEANRIAQRLGLSRPQIVNFKAGRFGINHTAAAALREYLKENAA